VRPRDQLQGVTRVNVQFAEVISQRVIEVLIREGGDG
jgi:hypothetical protein